MAQGRNFPVSRRTYRFSAGLILNKASAGSNAAAIMTMTKIRDNLRCCETGTTDKGTSSVPTTWSRCRRHDIPLQIKRAGRRQQVGAKRARARRRPGKRVLTFLG